MELNYHIRLGTATFIDKNINEKRIEKCIQDWFNRQGIEASIILTINDSKQILTINEIPCNYPDSLLEQIEQYVAKISDDNDVFGEMLVTQLLWLNSQELITEDFVKWYFSDLGILEPDFVTQLQKILIELVECKCSLKDKALINGLVKQILNENTSNWLWLYEVIFEQLNAKRVEIHIRKTYFIDIINSAENRNNFELLREYLFYENGIHYPPFEIIYDSSLPPQSYYFKINNYSSIPTFGLAFDKLLVNATTEVLGEIKGIPALNPANGNITSIISKNDQSKIEERAINKWDSFGYLVLSFSKFLRGYSFAFINIAYTENYLSKLGIWQQNTVILLQDKYADEITTQVLRRLAKENISILNGKLIAEAMLEYDYIVANSQDYIIFDERLPIYEDQVNGWRDNPELITEFVRSKMKRYISNTFRKGQNSLQVLQLDREIEEIISKTYTSSKSLTIDIINQINEAVKEEVQKFSVYSPSILTTNNIRPLLKRIIRHRFPDIPVLSYQELAAESNIQPLGRIVLK
jgi:type III secretory pathway component EscV